MPGSDNASESSGRTAVQAAEYPDLRILVFSYVFPSATRPSAGLFVRERMFRVGKRAFIIVVAPQPWFPFQGLLRLIRPDFRKMSMAREVDAGVEVHRPRYFSIPGLFKSLDGLFLAVSAYSTVRRLARAHRITLIDSHYGFPEGYAATLIGRWLKLPVCVTFRGKEEVQAASSLGAPLRKAVARASRVISVSEALRKVALGLGARPEDTVVVGNGVDLSKFSRQSQRESRQAMGLPQDGKVLISVGALSERKGFHRVIECLPSLLQTYPDLHFIAVGAGGPEGDMSAALREQVRSLGLAERVRFLGYIPPAELSVAYSAADVFVLATRYEGWANVFLEAMACGLPVVTTDVGGNKEVIVDATLGTIVRFGDAQLLTLALHEALARSWNREAIVSYAQSFAWERRIDQLMPELVRAGKHFPT
jgi:glycosyltransferase involved in cell wall biosynthesis